MPFVERDHENNIISIFLVPQYPDQEYIEGDVQLTQPPAPLSTRLDNLLKQAGGQLAADPNPQPETLQLVDAVMMIDAKLTGIATRFGGDTPLYRKAAKTYLGALGALPVPDFEQVRQAMLAECER